MARAEAARAPAPRHLIRWAEEFAARTRMEGSSGLADILAQSGGTGAISFSGGFPDPATFPGPVLAEVLRDILSSGETSALQYAPTRGLPGPRDYIASRLVALDGVRPAEPGPLVTSRAVACSGLSGKCFLYLGAVD